MLKLYPFPKEAPYLKNESYTIHIREEGGAWSEAVPYTVRIDPDFVQNMQPQDEFRESPMVYFDHDGPVEICIARRSGPIRTAAVHPQSMGIAARIDGGGNVLLRLEKPRPVCVSIDGDRQEMVYLLSGPMERDVPKPGDPGVRFLPPGVTEAPLSGHDVWDGGLRDIRVYDRLLTGEELEALAGGSEQAGYLYRWPMEQDFTEEKTGTPAAAYGTVAIGFVEDGDGQVPCACFDGVDGCLDTGLGFDMANERFTITAWVYRRSRRVPTVETIVGNAITVFSNGQPSSALGDWQYPFLASDTIPENRWTHVALTRENGVLRFYLDGRPAGCRQRQLEPGPFYFLLGASRVTRALCLRDGETLYISGGGVLDGTVKAAGAENVTIRGRGMIYLGNTDHNLRMTGISLTCCRDCRIEGVVVNDPRSMCTHLCECDGVDILNYKAFSSYGATDGIHMKSTSHVTIADCFLRSNDDCVSVYASIVNYQGGSFHIDVRDCTLISDAGHVFMSGIHGGPERYDTIHDVHVRNVDVVDSKCQYYDYQGVFGINTGNNVVFDGGVFEDVRIEDICRNQLFNLRIFYNPVYCTCAGKAVRNVVFRNISYLGRHEGALLPSQIQGDSSERLVENISFENITINGRRCRSFEEMELRVGEYARNIAIR